MRLPNVVIAGAPKCGTTSLHNWLADHPEVFGSSIKETKYLLDEGFPGFNPYANYRTNGLDGYKTYFSHRIHTNAKLILESTPSYIYQKTALEVLSNLTTKPKVIFVLRKPSERVFSLYNFAHNNAAAMVKRISFPQFIEMVKDDNNEFLKDKPILRDVIKHSQYVEYLHAWISSLESERIHVLLFEDMKKNPRIFMKALSQRLNIDPTFYDRYDFKRHMETYNIKIPFLHKFLKRTFSFTYSKINLIPAGSLREFLRTVYFKVISSKAGIKKSPNDHLVLKMLDKEFLPYNQRLAQMVKIDLSAWD